MTKKMYFLYDFKSNPAPFFEIKKIKSFLTFASILQLCLFVFSILFSDLLLLSAETIEAAPEAKLPTRPYPY